MSDASLGQSLMLLNPARCEFASPAAGRSAHEDLALMPWKAEDLFWAAFGRGSPA